MAISLLRNAFAKIFSNKMQYSSRKMTSKDFNEHFYQRILRVYEKDDSITINRIEKAPACEKGDSFVSDVSRVDVFGYQAYNTDQDYQKSVILKELPPMEQQALYRSNIAMQNENRAYNRIIPLLEKYSSGPLPLADCIHANEDVIILQDLAKDGFKAVGKASGGLTIEQCELVLAGLAKLHAASFVCKRKEPEKFAELTKMTKEPLFYGGDSVLLDYQNQFFNRVMEICEKMCNGEEKMKTLQVLRDLQRNSRALIKHLLLNPREHSVICHGDTWAGNVMVNKNKEVKLVDLQLMRYNSVASDLCYLLYVNLQPEIRMNNTQKLLEQYLNLLQKNIKEKGVNMDNVLTKGWLEKEMQTFAIYGVVFGMWIMPVFYVEKENVEISKERLSDTSTIAKYAGPDCDERLKNMILEYVRNLK